MMTVTRRFLIQLKRHNLQSYQSLPEELRMRYEKKSWDFSKGTQCHANRECIAADMLLLIAQHESDGSVNTRNTFVDMVRVFGEQCEVLGDKVLVRKKTGGATLPRAVRSTETAAFNDSGCSGDYVLFFGSNSHDGRCRLKSGLHTPLKWPKSRQAFWLAKFEANVARDKRNQRDLKRAGWMVIVLWECQVMHDPFAAVEKVLKTLSPEKATLDYDSLPDKRTLMKAAESRLHWNLASPPTA